jgi:hypothetical protein
MSKPFTPAALLCAALLAAPSPGQAGEGELTLGLGPSWASLPTRGMEGQSGLGGQLTADLRFGHFWGLTAGVGDGYLLSIPEEDLPGQHLGHLWVGVLYNLDVATYVPFATLSATAYLASPTLEDAEGQEVHAGARFSLGVDVRRHRHFSYGVEAAMHAFLTDLSQYPVFLTASLRLNYHLEVF